MGLNLFKKKNKTDSHYLTSKEVRAIAKENSKIMFALEKEKYRKCEESEFLSEMKDDRNILEIEDLNTYFFTEGGVVKAVNGVSINVPTNSVVGIVGESGCGKSVTSMSVMRLLQGPTGQIYSGSIRFKSLDYKRDAHGNPIPVYETDENGDGNCDEVIVGHVYQVWYNQVDYLFEEHAAYYTISTEETPWKGVSAKNTPFLTQTSLSR